MKTLHDFQVEAIDGSTFDLGTLRGKKVLVVNTASECGLTPQYEELEALYKKYKDSGFTIIGFPANNFGGQEPGTDQEIAQFCRQNYGVSFPMMSKISVKGDDTHPLYRWLTEKEQNGVADHEIKWNFHKFLVDEEGRLIRDIEPQASPMDTRIENWISGN